MLQIPYVHKLRTSPTLEATTCFLFPCEGTPLTFELILNSDEFRSLAAQYNARCLELAPGSVCLSHLAQMQNVQTGGWQNQRDNHEAVPGNQQMR